MNLLHILSHEFGFYWPWWLCFAAVAFFSARWLGGRTPTGAGTQTCCSGLECSVGSSFTIARFCWLAFSDGGCESSAVACHLKLKPANPAHSLDAPMSFSLHSGLYWRGTVRLRVIPLLHDRF
jgi:hypothetical protein